MIRTSLTVGEHHRQPAGGDHRIVQCNRHPKSPTAPFTGPIILVVSVSSWLSNADLSPLELVQHDIRRVADGPLTRENSHQMTGGPRAARLSFGRRIAQEITGVRWTGRASLTARRGVNGTR